MVDRSIALESSWATSSLWRWKKRSSTVMCGQHRCIKIRDALELVPDRLGLARHICEREGSLLQVEGAAI